jgi:3-oxoacyl-[acyl-carrier protein] reductase
MGDLEGKVALITGAGRGMGRSHALLLAQHGAEILVQDIDGGLAKETVGHVASAGGRARPLISDVAEVGELRSQIAAAESELGGIDILINNAGIVAPGSLEEIDLAAFDRMFGIHVKGSFFATQAVVPGMKRRGGGKIVNIASIWGMVGHTSESHYCGAKAALLGLTKAWAKELVPHKICVNAVAPGRIITEMVLQKGGMAYVEKQARASVPLGRYGESGEVSETVLFLVTSRSDFITGQVISPNGGETIVGI